MTLDGQERKMRLTLGALAELERHLKTPSLVALVERFESGLFSADDLLKLIAAGLKGAGEDVTEAELGQMTVAGGPVGAARSAAALLAATFGAPDG